MLQACKYEGTNRLSSTENKYKCIFQKIFYLFANIIKCLHNCIGKVFYQITTLFKIKNYFSK